MKHLTLTLLTMLSVATANAASKCTAVANQKLNKTLRTMGLPATAKVDLMDASKLKNRWGDKVLIYEAASIQLSEGSYLPEGTAQIVLSATDCASLKIQVELFAEVDKER